MDWQLPGGGVGAFTSSGQGCTPLGVLLHPSLSLEAQGTSMARMAYYQLKLTLPFPGQRSLDTVIHALATSQLDYCNELQVRLPLRLVLMWKLLQNAIARLLSGAP